MIDFVCDDVLDWATNYTGPKFHALLCDPPAGISFMSKSWDTDHGGRDTWIANMQTIFAAMLPHLHPGAHCIVWALPRTSHWTATALENAGLEVRDVITHVFGSGFPKSHNVGNTSRVFTGYGSSLKPAAEHWLICRKPLEGTIAENCMATGGGALNIDAGRIGTDKMGGYEVSPGGMLQPSAQRDSGYRPKWDREDRPFVANESVGRWPANFMLSHSPSCNGVCADDCPVRLLGEQSGERKPSGSYNRSVEAINILYGKGCGAAGLGPQDGYTDTGSAARFFFNADHALDNAEPFYYCAKASRGERDKGLEGMPIVAEQTLNDGWIKQDDKAGTNRHGAINPRNNHPTVKPLKLARYLATLLLPPAAYAPRRLLNPFGGSGSESIGALLAGWDEIVYVEREAEYVEIAKRRAEYWQAQQPLPTLFEAV